MDIKVAAFRMIDLVNDAPLLPEAETEGVEESTNWSKAHLLMMCRKIADGEIEGEKAHRWLGWVQACVCFGAGATLEELKRINYSA